MTRIALNTVVVVALAVMIGVCGGRTSTPTSPTNPTTPPTNQAVCGFSFSPAKAEASSSPQRITVQVTANSSCSWTATSSVEWVMIIRTGPLYHNGSGPLTFDVASNLGQCPTLSRSSWINIAEQASKGSARLEVFQWGSTASYQPPPGCAVSPISYGATVRNSLTGGDCAAPRQCFLKGGHLSMGPKAKYYTFQAFAGQEISIFMVGGGLLPGGISSPLLRLVGPTGALFEESGAAHLILRRLLGGDCPVPGPMS